MTSIAKTVRDRIEMLHIRREITLLEYTFSLNFLLKTRLPQELYESKGRVKTIIVTHHMKVVNLLAALRTKLPETTRVLSVPYPTPAALGTGETAQGVADGFSVLLNKIMEGMLPSFPEIVGLSMGVQYEKSLFPGALTWILTESDLVPTIDSRLSLWLGASKVNSNVSSQGHLSSSFLIPEGTRKPSLAKTTDNIMQWLLEDQGSVVLMACASHVLGFDMGVVTTSRVVNIEDGGPLKKQKLSQ